MRPHLVEHVSEIIFGIHPGGYCITEEDEVLQKVKGVRIKPMFLFFSYLFGRSHYSSNQPVVAAERLTCTTPPGFTPIIMQIPRKAESFSSLSRMFRRDVHLPYSYQPISSSGENRILIIWMFHPHGTDALEAEFDQVAMSTNLILFC